MIKYKLTAQDLTTHNGFQWELNKTFKIGKPTNELCSSGVFHYYNSPEQAVLFNQAHADIENPRLFEVVIDKEANSNGLKGGCHEMTLVRELKLPVFTTVQIVTFAIRTVLLVYSDLSFVAWAESWISGEDRSPEAARAAARAAEAAARAAARAAMAARAAARAADRAAARAAARAAWAAARAAWAAWAAEAAARAAWAATWAAEAAAEAARTAAWAAEAAARAPGNTTLDFQKIIEDL